MLKSLSAIILAATTGVLSQEAAAQSNQQRVDSTNQEVIVDVGAKLITQKFATSAMPGNSAKNNPGYKIFDCNTNSIFMRVDGYHGAALTQYQGTDVSQEAARICKKYGL